MGIDRRSSPRIGKQIRQQGQAVRRPELDSLMKIDQWESHRRSISNHGVVCVGPKVIHAPQAFDHIRPPAIGLLALWNVPANAAPPAAQHVVAEDRIDTDFLHKVGLDPPAPARIVGKQGGWTAPCWVAHGLASLPAEVHQHDGRIAVVGQEAGTIPRNPKGTRFRVLPCKFVRSDYALHPAALPI